MMPIYGRASGTPGLISVCLAGLWTAAVIGGFVAGPVGLGIGAFIAILIILAH